MASRCTTEGWSPRPWMRFGSVVDEGRPEGRVLVNVGRSLVTAVGPSHWQGDRWSEMDECCR